MTDQTYTYKPLPGHRDIRLLKLHPGFWEDNIRCELDVISLDEQPQYEALSHAWGSNENTEPISLDGKTFLTSITLESAFRRLRAEKRPRILWVDWICINQDDADERRVQVSLMRDIYTNCQRVFIWLGGSNTPEPKSELSASSTCKDEYAWGDARKDYLKILSFEQQMYGYLAAPIATRHHSEQDYVLGAFCFIRLLSSSRHIYSVPFVRDVIYRGNVFKALNKILCHDWWTRIWVVQEAVLAPCAMIMYDRFLCPWEIFALAAGSFARHRLSCCRNFLERLPAEDEKIPRNFSRVVWELEEARHSWRDERHPMTILPLLWQFRSRKSSDPRDKVYSLLSMVKSWGPRPQIAPDYTLPPEQLYRTIVRELIRITSKLSVLMGTLTKPGGLANLPSWVPDWTVQPTSFEQDRLVRADLYGASADHPPAVKYFGDKFLESQGLIVTKISTVGEVMPPHLGDLELKVFRQWYRLAGLHRDPHVAYVAGGTAIEAYWRTLCLDSLFKAEAGPLGICKRKFVRAPPDYGSSYESWVRKAGSRIQAQESKGSGDGDGFRDVGPMAVATERPPPELESYWILLQNGPLVRPPNLSAAIDHAIRSATAHRRFFITDKGYVGLGPPNLKPGGEVCILFGGPTPFIIRSTGNQTVCRFGPKPCYELIGDCYVDGLMDGQVFKIPGLTKESIHLGPRAHPLAKL